MVRSLGALLLAGALAATAWAQPSGADAEIRSLLEKYQQSVNDLNLDLAEEIWSQDSDVSFIHPRGHERGWPDIREKFYLGTMGGLPTSPADTRRRTEVRRAGGVDWGVRRCLCADVDGDRADGGGG